MRSTATYLVVTAALVATTTSCKRSKRQHDQPVEQQVIAVVDTPKVVSKVEPSKPVEVQEPDSVVEEVDTISSQPNYRLVLSLLKQRRLDSFAAYVHPKGVVFSPYSFISDPQVIPDSMLMNLYSSDSVLHWGLYDGSGDSINMSFSEYFESFVYNADYLSEGDTSVNRAYHAGNSLNNFKKYFPNAMYIDFHLEGSEEYGGMDWKTLRLGFEKVKGKWKVVALIHDEWTI